MKHRLQTLLKHKLQWLALLTALLGVSRDVYADMGFWNEGTWSIQYEKDGASRTFSNYTDKTTSIDLGSLSTLRLRGFKVKSWGSEADNCYAEARVNGSSFNNTQSSYTDLGSGNKEWKFDQVWNENIISKYSSLVSGTEYSFTIYAKIHNNQWNYDREQTFTVKFTYSNPCTESYTIYFDNSATQWANVGVLIGNSGSYSLQKCTRVTGTDVWYYSTSEGCDTETAVYWVNYGGSGSTASSSVTTYASGFQDRNITANQISTTGGASNLNGKIFVPTSATGRSAGTTWVTYTASNYTSISGNGRLISTNGYSVDANNYAYIKVKSDLSDANYGENGKKLKAWYWWENSSNNKSKIKDFSYVGYNDARYLYRMELGDYFAGLILFNNEQTTGSESYPSCNNNSCRYYCNANLLPYSGSTTCYYDLTATVSSNTNMSQFTSLGKPSVSDNDVSTGSVGTTFTITLGIATSNTFGGNTYRVYASDGTNLYEICQYKTAAANISWTPTTEGNWTLYSIATDKYGAERKKSDEINITVTPACSKPAANFTTVKAQLNAGGGSPWAGSEATTSSAASDGYFADGHRTITLTETNGSYAYYQWEVSTNNGSSYSDISGASSASSSYTAPLPGTYKFRCKAGCSSSDYSTSGAITVNVPYPSMGIEGPGIKGCAAWTPSYASGSGIMTRSGLTWSGTVTVNATGTTDGAFIIIQQYKNGATSGTGWASCTEDGNACSGTCDGDDIKGNTVNKDCKRNTLTNLDKVDGGNYYFNSNKFAADQQVKITVTMTAYNTYTVTACLVPQSLSITGPIQACVNDATLTAMVASVTATSPSYQWQESSDASSWADVSTGSGDKTASYTPAKSVSAKYYRCAVTACGVTENSTHKQYTIYGASVAGSIAQKTSGATSPLGICKNATATLVLSGNTGSIQWQKYNSSTSKFEDKSGETGSEYTTTAKNATGTDYYRAAVTNGTCATAYTATTTAGAFQVVSYNPVDAGTVALTPNEVCVGEDSQASVTGVELAGGVGDWSAGSGASIDSDGSIETSSSGTPSITYTISSYKCAGTASANATLTVKATPSFSITPASPSGTAWKPVTLSTSPTQTGAEWSITTNHSEAGDATSVGYLSTTSGSGTVFKGPAPASSGSNTFVVQATVTNGSTGCSKTVTKNVSVSYEDCE